MPRETTPDTTPLPTSKATTNIFNGINLRGSQQSTLLSTIGSLARTQPVRARRPRDDDEDGDDLNYFDGTLGIGVKDAKKKAREASQADQELRQKMFGKRRREEEERRRREGSSDEEEGRGGVGKKKKKVRTVREDDADGGEDAVLAPDAGESSKGEGVEVEDVDSRQIQGGAEGPSKKKKKNKNKKKRKAAEE